MPRFVVLFITLLLVFTLTGCMKPVLFKPAPDVPRSQAEADLAQCRLVAMNAIPAPNMLRTLDSSSSSEPASTDPYAAFAGGFSEGFGAGYQLRMMKEREKAVLTACMVDRGHTVVSQ